MSCWYLARIVGAATVVVQVFLANVYLSPAGNWTAPNVPGKQHKTYFKDAEGGAHVHAKQLVNKPRI